MAAETETNQPTNQFLKESNLSSWISFGGYEAFEGPYLDEYMFQTVHYIHSNIHDTPVSPFLNLSSTFNIINALTCM